MKKLILALFMVFPVGLFAGKYPANVVVALEMENNIINTGSLPVTITSNVPFTTDKKYGDYAMGRLVTNTTQSMSFSMTTTVVSVDVWFKSFSTDSNKIDAIWSNGDSMLLYGYPSGATFGSYLFRGSPFWQLGAYNVSTDAWHRYQIDFDGTYITVYLDGVYKGQRTDSYQPVSTSWKIGNRNNGEQFQGVIDNFIMVSSNQSGSEPSPMPSPTFTFTNTPECTATNTPSPTYTETWTLTPTLTATPSLTATKTFTATPTSTPTVTPIIKPAIHGDENNGGFFRRFRMWFNKNILLKEPNYAYFKFNYKEV